MIAVGGGAKRVSSRPGSVRAAFHDAVNIERLIRFSFPGILQEAIDRIRRAEHFERFQVEPMRFVLDGDIFHAQRFGERGQPHQRRGAISRQ